MTINPCKICGQLGAELEWESFYMDGVYIKEYYFVCPCCHFVSMQAYSQEKAIKNWNNPD